MISTPVLYARHCAFKGSNSLQMVLIIIIGQEEAWEGHNVGGIPGKDAQAHREVRGTDLQHVFKLLQRWLPGTELYRWVVLPPASDPRRLPLNSSLQLGTLGFLASLGWKDERAEGLAPERLTGFSS